MTTETAAAPVARDDEYLNVTKRLTRFVSFAGGGFNIVMALGGVVLAATATSPLAVAAGVGAVVVGAFKTYSATMMLLNLDQVVQSKSATPEETRADMAKKLRVPKFMLHPAAQLGMGVVTLGAGLALFAGAGFLASVAAFCMTLSGGFNTLTSGIALGGNKYLEGSFMSTKSSTANDNPAPDLSPASKLDALKPSAEFKAAADIDAKTPLVADKVEPIAAPEVKTPKTGG